MMYVATERNQMQDRLGHFDRTTDRDRVREHALIQTSENMTEFQYENLAEISSKWSDDQEMEQAVMGKHKKLKRVYSTSYPKERYSLVNVLEDRSSDEEEEGRVNSFPYSTFCFPIFRYSNIQIFLFRYSNIQIFLFRYSKYLHIQTF